MAGAAKKRQAKERRQTRQEESSSNEKSSPEQASPEEQSPPGQSPVGGFDGERDPEPRQTPQLTGPTLTEISRNLDLGARAHYLAQGYGSSIALPPRPKVANKTGREVNIRLNSFHVLDYPSKPVHQYDVLVGSGAEKRAVIKKVWNAPLVQNALGPGWIFDGSKIAWSLKSLAPFNVTVDLDALANRKPRKSGPDNMTIAIRRTKQVDFASLTEYLAGRYEFDNGCLEAITFLDHLLRERPSQRYTQHRRNFFGGGNDRFQLGNGVEALKGVYASIRQAHIGIGQPGVLSVNVDVANGTFYEEQSVDLAAQFYLDLPTPERLVNTLKAGQGNPTPPLRSVNAGFRRVQVYTKHRGPEIEAKEKTDPFTIDSVLNQSAREYKFNEKLEDGVTRETTLFDYFRSKHGMRLQKPDLPVLQMTKKSVVLPMEVCWIKQNQRYPFKLTERQTTRMIQFAVTPPQKRWQAIQEGLGMLDWPQDQYLQNYGLKISKNPTTVKARLLPNPKVRFGNQEIDPKTSGRWDLKGKRFHEPHPTPLKSWGICVMPGRDRPAVDLATAQNFAKSFIQIFSQHGGKFQNQTPVILQGTNNPAEAVEAIYTKTGNTNQFRPQLLIFILPDKNELVYGRIKKSCDCRYGVVSQCLQSFHVQKSQAQYISNVCMKVNAKLGGHTAQAEGIRGTASWFKRPTMVIGADVSHASFASHPASIAALTVSWDRRAIKYVAGVQTNGHRVELIAKETFETQLKPLLERWVPTVGGGHHPQHLIYFRDGVSEGQYSQVIETEVNDIRVALQELNPQVKTEITVIVASKRHHVRFFPDPPNSGDRNSNPHPGTLVETGVTHPFEYDFYLNAHSAIKGTARPVHYHVLLDEANMGLEEIQNMIYESSYQYVRSTTPVSLFPAVYYAHIAAARGIFHLDVPAVSSGNKQKEAKGAKSRGTPVSDGPETKPLIKLGVGCERTMWYV